MFYLFILLQHDVAFITQTDLECLIYVPSDLLRIKPIQS